MVLSVHGCVCILCVYIYMYNRSYILYTYIDVVEYIHSYKLLFSHEKFSIFPGCSVLMTPRIFRPLPLAHHLQRCREWTVTVPSDRWGCNDCTLWLCQNSNGKWPFIVDFPMKDGDFP